jgi:sulfoxide reductase heme-binding subunit YedZ
MAWLKNNWRLVITHVGAMLPMVTIVRDWFIGELTANPIQAAILRTGKPALVLLVLLLACTPLNTFFGWNWVIPLRKWLGIYSSFYTGVHFLVFAGLDYRFDLSLLYEAIFFKRYAIAGFVAGIFLIPLTLTSTEGWKRRLGKWWKQLHKLVYAAAVLSGLHYIWLVKSDLREPLLYCVIILLLLMIRIPKVNQSVTQVRHLLARIVDTRLTGQR